MRRRILFLAELGLHEPATILLVEQMSFRLPDTNGIADAPPSDFGGTGAHLQDLVYHVFAAVGEPDRLRTALSVRLMLRVDRNIDLSARHNQPSIIRL